MAQRRFHYDQAFERYLRHRAIPYIAVDEAKRALRVRRRTPLASGRIASTAQSRVGGEQPGVTESLKSFDFVVYTQSGPNLLIDVKGRKHTGRSNRSLDNWVTQADVDCMGAWEKLFGQDFEAAFAFLYWCQEPPPDALFQDVFECGGRWYAALGIKLAAYRFHAKRRSPRWGTVYVPAAEFARRAVPLKDLLQQEQAAEGSRA